MKTTHITKSPFYAKDYYTHNREILKMKNLDRYYKTEREIKHCDVCDVDTHFFEVHLKSKRHLNRGLKKYI